MIRQANRWSFYSLALALVMVALSFPWTGGFHIIVWDMFGYYLYLPEFFIYHDLGIHDTGRVHEIMKLYNSSPVFYQAHPLDNGNHIPQYPIGMAILFLPFFLCGHGIAQLFSYPADGFSAPYEWSLLIGNYAYVIMGMILVRKFLLHFFNEKISAILLLLLCFGTNYYKEWFYALASPHVLIFALFTGFLLLVIRWHKSPSLSTAFFAGALLGLMTITRYTEIFAGLLFLCWDVRNGVTFIQKIKDLLSKYLAHTLLFLAGWILLLAPLLLYWKVYTGFFFYNSYRNAGEGMDFLSPHTLNFLFSFRKGWFLYTPLMFFVIAGFVHLYRFRKNIFPAILVFFLVNTYVLSCWSCWWYAGGFGQRAMVDSYALLMLPLGYLIGTWTGKRRFLYLIFIPLIVLNLFQSWQMNQGILHPSRVTKEYYFAIFGRTRIPEHAEKLLLLDRNIYGPDKFDSLQYSRLFIASCDFEKGNCFAKDGVTNAHGFHSGHCLQVLDTFPYSDSWHIPFKILSGDHDHAWVKVKFRYFYTGAIADCKPTAVLTFRNQKKQKYAYNGFELEKPEFHAEPGKWNEATCLYLTPEVRNEKDNFSLFFWLRGKGSFFVDDIVIESYTKK